METTATTQNTPETEYPLLGDRVQSSFIDLVFILILMFISATLLERMKNPPDWLRIGLFVLIFILYEPLCTTLGFTIGNYFKKIRVRKVSNTSKRINLLQAIIRYILKAGLGWISFLTIHSNKERRAIHDFAAGSVMIKIED
jgi:uncharacterized RDD family membrane protein YckC